MARFLHGVAQTRQPTYGPTITQAAAVLLGRHEVVEIFCPERMC
jgi:hypothetical protein